MSDAFLWVYLIIVFVILVSLQYTLNRVLKTLTEIKSMKRYDMRKKDE